MAVFTDYNKLKKMLTCMKVFYCRTYKLNRQLKIEILLHNHESIMQTFFNFDHDLMTFNPEKWKHG